MRTVKLLMVSTFFCLFYQSSLMGQVTTQPNKITIEGTSGSGFFLDAFSPTREFKVNRFGQVLLRNNANGSITDYWHFGARDNGDLDIALDTLGSNTVVASASALMTFKPDGNIGIGTNVPDTKLHISNGEVTGAASGFRIDMIIEDDDSAILQFRGEDFSGISFFDDATSSHAGYFYDYTNDAAQIRTGGIDNRLFVTENGKIGIADTTPSAQLHIQQEGIDEEALALQNNGDGNDIWAFEIGGNDLILTYDSDGDGVSSPITHGVFDEGTLGQYISSDHSR